MLEAKRKFKCYICKHEWSVPYGTIIVRRCPKCGSTSICRASDDRYRRGLPCSLRSKNIKP